MQGRRLVVLENLKVALIPIPESFRTKPSVSLLPLFSPELVPEAWRAQSPSDDYELWY
jgi:hypothetical protein